MQKPYYSVTATIKSTGKFNQATVTNLFKSQKSAITYFKGLCNSDGLNVDELEPGTILAKEETENYIIEFEKIN